MIINNEFFSEMHRNIAIRALIGKKVSYSSLGYAFCHFLNGCEEDTACTAFMDCRKRLVSISFLDISHSHICDVIEKNAAIYKAKYFSIAHTHAGKPLIPSNEDLITTDLLLNRYKLEKPQFWGHYIVSCFDYYLINSQKNRYV